MEKIIPAKRLNSVSEYYFSTKLREVAQYRARGFDVISLGIGSPIWQPSDETLDALEKEARRPEAHGYQPYAGIPELREAMAEWYWRWFGVMVQPQQEVLPLLGSKEGILHIALAFLNPGDGVLVPNPGYPTYTSANELVGATVIPYNLLPENNWQPDFNELENTDLSKVKIMWVNYPNMPTGAPASLELFEKLVNFGRRHNIVICNDNPYSFILNPEKLSIFAVKGAKDICIEMNSMSKSHNMAGWRVGMCVSNAEFISWILKVKSNVDSGSFRGIQHAAIAAFENSEEWHKAQNLMYAANRMVAEQIYNTLGVRFDKGQVGMFLWGEVPMRYANGEVLADLLLKEALIFVTPGFIFGSQGERYIRISLCATKERLQEALARIEQFVKQQGNARLIEQ